MILKFYINIEIIKFLILKKFKVCFKSIFFIMKSIWPNILKYNNIRDSV